MSRLERLVWCCTVNPANAPLTSQRKQATSGKQRDRHPFNEQQRIGTSANHNLQQPLQRSTRISTRLAPRRMSGRMRWFRVMLTTSSDSHAGWMDGKRRLLSPAMVATLSRD